MEHNTSTHYPKAEDGIDYVAPGQLFTLRGKVYQCRVNYGRSGGCNRCAFQVNGPLPCHRQPLPRCMVGNADFYFVEINPQNANPKNK